MISEKLKKLARDIYYYASNNILVYVNTRDPRDLGP